jgi:hypothetical protein
MSKILVDRKVLEQALEALENAKNFWWPGKDAAITALRAALEQPKQDHSTAVHMSHCNQGEWEGVCKYNEEDCPALDQRDELLEALKLAQQCLSGSDDPTLLPRTCKAVDTAIVKAES